jgi:hypothetical protein
MTRAINWTQYDKLKAQGLADREIARRWDIPWSTFHREKSKREGIPAPVQRPVQSTDIGAVHSVDTGAVQRLNRLEDEVQGLRQLMQAVIDRLDHPPV